MESQEWRNIQDVVKVTFKAFHDVLRAQGEAIKALERTVDTKAGRTEMAAALQQKANAAEMAGRLAELESILHKKADISDLERRALRTDVEASLRTQMADVFTVINTKSEDTEFRSWRDSSERQLGQLRTEMTRLASNVEDARSLLHTKASMVEVSTALSLKADSADVDQKLRDKAGRRQVSESLAQKADVSGVDLILGQLRQEVADVGVAVGRKAESARVEEVSHRVERLRQRVEADSDTTASALRTISSTFDSAIAEVQQQMAGTSGQVAALHHGLKEMDQRMERRVGDVAEAARCDLSQKADTTDVVQWLDTKADARFVEQELAAKAGVGDLDELGTHVDGIEAKMAAVSGLGSRLDALQRDLTSKMGADRGIYASLEGKANIDDVNKALSDVCRELEKRAAMEQLDVIVRDQVMVKSSLQQSNTMARWLWKSGRTKGGGAVPWNVQAANTDPSNFIFEADKTVVVAMLPGLYEIAFGFFSKRRPVVQVLVNGEPIMTAVGSSATAIHHAAAADAADSRHLAGLDAATSQHLPQQQHSAGHVTGLTCLDFLSLPARATVALTYQGDEQAEAFLSLRKL